MRPTFVLGVLVAGASLVIGGCAGGAKDKTDDELTADIATSLQDADDTLSDDAAACWAGVIVEVVGADEIQDLDLTSDAPPPELEDAFAEAALEAQRTCDLST